MSTKERKDTISGDKVKQVILILIIIGLLAVMIKNLSMFIPALLGAVTLYIVSRDFNFYLQEKRKWKPSLASFFILFIYLLVLIIPSYFLVDLIVEKAVNTETYLPKIEKIAQKAQEYITEYTDINIASGENLKDLANYATTASTQILSSTLNIFSVVAAMFFILYFMLEGARGFEKISTSTVPFKRANSELIGKKFRKLVMANAVGIPVVALGQGIVALVGYYIFGAPSPVLFFAFTVIASMIPIVGAAIVYLPISLYMFLEGDQFGGIGLALYCLIVVGLTDNVLRFTLLKKLEDIHPLNTVFGIIMGMNLFGFMGLIFGPILVSMTVLLLQVYRDEFSDDEEPLLHLPNGEMHESPVDDISV